MSNVYQACDAAEKAVQIAKSVGARDVEGDALHALAAGFAARRLFEDCSKVTACWVRVRNPHDRWRNIGTEPDLGGLDT